MIGGNKTNKQIQTATTPSKFKTAVKHGFIYAAILCLATMFIIAVSILSDISQNRDHYVYATVNTDGSGNSSSQVAQTESEIDSAIQMFFVYQRLLGCRDEYSYNPDAKWSPVETIGVMSDGGTVAIVKDFTKESQHAKLQGICTTELMQEQITALGSDVDLLEKMKEVAGPSGNCEETNSSDSSCYKSISGKQIASILTEILNQYKEYSYSELTGAERFKLYLNAFDTCVKSDGDDDKCRGGGVDLNLSVTDANDSNVNEKYWVINGFEYDSETGEVQGKQVYAPRCDTEIYWNGKESDGEIEHFIWPGNQSPQMNGLATAAYGGGHNITCQGIANGVNAYFKDYVIAKAEAGESTSIEDITTSSSSSVDEEDPCQAGFLGFGWLFCPGANLIDRFLNGFLNWIDSQLNWTMLAENNTVIRERWQNFLNIANIAFAIAFLVMIYSMATSTGLSNYDIKKMLPRLIVVAIAVNLSFYICAAIVDIFNIIGNGIFGIINPDGDTWSVSVGVDGFVGFGATIVAIIGVVFIFGISAIIALAIIFICLCVREIALIALVVISPIAFVCYLLPNTQKWFQRWADYFIRLLAIYPMFMAVWGAAKWVASLKGSTPASKDVMPGFVVSLTCMIAPAIAIVPLFKMSGGIMGMAASRAAGSKLAARGQAAQGYMRNRGKQAYHNSMIGRGIDRHRDRVKNLDKQVNEGSYAGYNPWRRARQAINRGIYSRIGAKGTSSDKDLGSFLKNYTYVDGFGNIQHLTDDQMLNYIQGRAAEDNNGNVILAAQNLNAEQIGSGIKALSGNALEDVSGKTTTGGAPVAATDASKRYAHLQATSYMHEMYAKHGIDIGKDDPSDAYKQLSDLATSGSYVDKSGTKHTFGSHSPVRSDAAEMKRLFDANAGSADAEKIFNEEAKSFQTKRQSSAIKTTISGFTDAAAKRESDEISQALGSAMKAREFKKNAFKSGTSTPPSP